MRTMTEFGRALGQVDENSIVRFDIPDTKISTFSFKNPTIAQIKIIKEFDGKWNTLMARWEVDVERS